MIEQPKFSNFDAPAKTVAAINSSLKLLIGFINVWNWKWLARYNFKMTMQLFYSVNTMQNDYQCDKTPCVIIQYLEHYLAVRLDHPSCFSSKTLQLSY